jgi:replicative DNA helicase
MTAVAPARVRPMRPRVEEGRGGMAERQRREKRDAMAPATAPGDLVPPHNLDAEKSLLGAMMLSADAASVGLSLVRADDYYRSAHGRIHAAIEHLFGRGEPIDVITAAARLEASGELEQVGGKGYLLDIVNTVPLAGNVGQYGAIVKRTSMLRRLIQAATRIAALGYQAPDDIDEVVEQAEKAIFDVTNERVETTFRPIEELMAEGWHKLEELYERQEHLTGITTGYPSLNEILAGMHRGDLLILAARPSVGKTAFALNVAVHAAQAGSTVGVFSLEMSSEQLVMRILSSESRVDSSRLRTGRLGDNDWKPIMDAIGRLDVCDLHVDDTPALSVLELRAKARRLLRGKEKGLIIVDYLQLMQPQRARSENRQVEIAEISRGLKILAKELDVPVLALSQLSRAVEQRADKRPILSDLRESGSIEQDSDVVMFIHRDAYGRSEEEDGDGYSKMPPKGIAEIIVAKHRNGPTGSTQLVYHESFMRFVEPPKRPA